MQRCLARFFWLGPRCGNRERGARRNSSPPTSSAGIAQPEYGGDVAGSSKTASGGPHLAWNRYEVPIGTVAIEGMTLDMKPYPFPLR
jgi:hypothetical protein